MRVAITGSRGLIGEALVAALVDRGDTPERIVRGAGDGIHWDPERATIDAAGLDHVDAIVHLAGEGIGEKKWTDAQKQRIRQSRVQGTTLLSETIAALEHPPAVLVSASAIGWYGNRGDEELTEASPPPVPDEFLAEVCRAWEGATGAAEAAGVRTVHVRTGVVLTPTGGALSRMLTPFKLGLGGRIGTGRQYMSWLTLEDEVGAILHAVDTADLRGPVNLTAPSPVTNAEFTKALGHALHRPTLLPVPTPTLNAMFGKELVQHLLLEGQRVLPVRLQETGYRFRHESLADAFEAMDL